MSEGLMKQGILYLPTKEKEDVKYPPIFNSPTHQI